MGGYTYTLGGLFTCYAMGLPFLKNTLFSTVLFSVIVYMLYHTIELFSINYKKINS